MLAGFLALVLSFSAFGFSEGTIEKKQLPREALETIALIRKGGPFPHERDGVVFGNREKLLPPRKRGWYREYTVRTPGERTRGARRIVAGRDGTLHYSDDHYRSFKRILE
ncbi:MAG: ribonuclease domain-containing protein [Burkholderiales bacterium]